jgi:long-chain acyl-CoA synthetase
MFKSGGFNVYPREVEVVLETHPSVKAAAVIGVNDATWGEVGHAFVELRHPAADARASLHKVDFETSIC